MKETLQALPLEWVRRIFYRMEGFYGSVRMGNIWGVDANKLNNTFHIWAEELANFKDHPQAIAYALKNFPNDPPNLIQFREICREGLKHEPKPPAIERKYTPEELAENRKRVKELLNSLQRKAV